MLAGGHRAAAPARAARGHPGAGGALPPPGQRARGAPRPWVRARRDAPVLPARLARQRPRARVSLSSGWSSWPATRMVVMKDLPSHLRIQVIDFERATRRLPATGVDLRELLTELEERFIAEALARTGGNRNRAADLLGIEPHHAGRETSPSLRRLTKEKTHISVGERSARSPDSGCLHVGILETVTRLTASRTLEPPIG